MHTMDDLLRNAPCMCLITGHEERDQTFMEDYPYESGCFYMFDKMYFKTRGLERVRLNGAFFVIRIKSNVIYEVVDDMPVGGVHVLADRLIRFTSRWASRGYPGNLRLISFYSAEKNSVISFVTNNFDLDAATIALLYHYRWQIELFFRWIKTAPSGDFLLRDISQCGNDTALYSLHYILHSCRRYRKLRFQGIAL